jgi:hypothetical protein
MAAVSSGLRATRPHGRLAAARAPAPGATNGSPSHDRERRPVARRLLALTHLVFWAEAATGMIPSALRGRLAPLAAPLVPALAGSPRLIARGIRLVSQLSMSYRDSPVSVEGTAGRPGGPAPGTGCPISS